MKAVNNLLKEADNNIRHSEFINRSDETIEDVYKGYVSSFGAAVIMSGLVPALAFYIEDDKRKKVLDVIAKTSGDEANGTALFNKYKIITDRIRLRTATEKIVDASIAVKIMMRTYKFVTVKKESYDEC